MPLLIEVITWDPARRFGFKILNVPFPSRVTEYVYSLEPEHGGTRVTLAIELEMVRWLAFAVGLQGRVLVRSNRHELHTAKQLLEAGPAS